MTISNNIMPISDNRYNYPSRALIITSIEIKHRSVIWQVELSANSAICINSSKSNKDEKPKQWFNVQ